MPKTTLPEESETEVEASPKTAHPCPDCNGTKEIDGLPCERCEGTGVEK